MIERGRRSELSSVVALLTSFGLVCAWLNPDHYPPWMAFQSEATAAAAMAVLLMATLYSAKRWHWPLLAVVSMATALLVGVQFLVGLIKFGGDAWMAALYLTAFGLAIATGATLGAGDTPRAPWNALWWALVIAASASVGAELVQWFSIYDYRYWVTPLPLHGRPSGNLAQPNQLATLLGLGLVGTLALREVRRINGRTAVFIGAWLIVGLVLTRSRVAWLIAALLFLWFAGMKRRNLLSHSPLAIGILFSFFLALQASINAIATFLQLTGARNLADHVGSGTRSDHWIAMVDALGRSPWWGYGWNQVAVAQSLVAADHVATAEQIEHSHNLVLDLLVWNGLPIGLLLAGTTLWWFISRWRRLCDAQAAHMFLAVAIVFAHALVEYPLDYAYFLLPVGLMMGAVDGLTKAQPVVIAPRWWACGLWAGCIALAGLVVSDYLRAEENFRVLRIESARIGTEQITSSPPDLLLLSQQQAFLAFARTEAHEGMSPHELEQMRTVAQRFGFAPVLFRYALASALNGHPAEARRGLETLCVTQLPARCDEGRQAWDAMRSRAHPQLAAIAYPPTPELGKPITK